MPYRDGIVAFVDVLGWSEIVERSAREPGVVEKLSGVLERVKGRISEIVSGEGYSHGAKAHQFSDAHFLTIDKSDDRTRIGPEYAALWCRLLAREYLKEGMLVRGGVTIGKFFDDGFACFGPAVTRAYRLEQEVGDPMIVLDPSERVREIFLDPEQYGFLIGSLGGAPCTINPLARTRDGRVFVDYLRPDVASNPTYRPLDVLSEEDVENAVRRIRDSDAALKVRSKIEWYLRYAAGDWRSREVGFLEQINFPAVSGARRRLTREHFEAVTPTSE